MSTVRMTPIAAEEGDGELSYRALQPWAVTSVAVGVMSAFSFIHWIFLILAALAALAGWVGLRKIAANRDMYSGERIAQCGLAMGLFFGLGALTNMGMTHMLIYRDGKRTVEIFADTLRKGDLPRAFWLTMPQALVRGLDDPAQRLTPPSDRYPGFLQQGAIHFKDPKVRATLELDRVLKHGSLRGQDFLIARYHFEVGDKHKFLVVNSVTQREPFHNRKEWYIRDAAADDTGEVEARFVGEPSGGGGHGHAH